LEELNKKYRVKANKLFISQNKSIEKEDISRTNSFHWDFEFPEVFLAKKGFNVIIGNPPYVRADSDDEIHILQRKIIGHTNDYSLLFEKWDLFVAFLERSLKHLLNPNGTFGFILSDSLCTVKYAEKIREYLIESLTITRIEYFEDYDVFSGIGVNPIIIYVQNSKQTKTSPNLVEKIIRKFSYENITSVESLPQTIENVFKKQKSPVLDMDFSDCDLLGDICFISKGMVLNSDEKKYKGEFKKADLISEHRDKIHNRPYVEGKDLSRFHTKRIRFLEWDTDRVPKKISRPTFIELYTGEKIIRGSFTDGVFDRNQLCSNHSNYILKRYIDLKGIANKSITQGLSRSRVNELEPISENYCYEYLLMIINSAWANEFLNSIRRANMENVFYPDEFKLIPIKRLEKKNQEIFKTIEQYLEFLYAIDTENVNADAKCVDLLGNLLVLELYYVNELFKDGIYKSKTRMLANLVSAKLADIDKELDFAGWNALYWKSRIGTLDDSEHRKLSELNEKIKSQLSEFSKGIRQDSEINGLKIKILEYSAINSIKIIV
jgi:adenine-specific DNA-methyltransferase